MEFGAPSQLRIRKLVIGAGANSNYSRSLMKPLSREANYLLQRAPEFCHIWFVGKDHLMHMREGVKQTSPDVEGRLMNASNNNKPDEGTLSQELSFRLNTTTTMTQ